MQDTDEEPGVIAVGLDYSAASGAAAGWAARQARIRGLALRLVHGWRTAPSDRPASGAAPGRERARRLLDDTRDRLTGRYPGLSVTADLVEEPPGPALLAAARDARALVLGTHGLHRLPRFFLGGTGQEVVARAERPVVLVRAGMEPGPEPEAAADGEPAPAEEPRQTAPAEGAEPPETPAAGPEEAAGRGVTEAAAEAASEAAADGAPGAGPGEGRVVVGIGLDHTYDNVLGFAFRVADEAGLPLHVVHGGKLPQYVYLPGGPPIPHLARDFRERVEQEMRAVIRPWAEKFPDVELRGGLRLEGAAHALIHEAAGSDLLVIGRCRRHRAGFGDRVGPVAQAAVHHAACPVAVVPHG
ncbi:universal stress protein [Streptomyces sp. JJ36]|uniref:universal stress protein n=1 Tax=Streptomyces sp. JJ36 TaxID=2736645 RepID=UPI001F3460AA|nr:universal stress protein [Streptomyces sp. JJ36]MCF6522840.1 universal stress protein [Streptomyces sp. JJ36]